MRGSGGTDGGVGMFFIGLGLAVLAVYLFFDSVRVTTEIGLISGFFGGWWDIVIMRLTDTFLSLLYLMVAIVLAAVLGASVRNIILVLVIIG